MQSEPHAAGYLPMGTWRVTNWLDFRVFLLGRPGSKVEQAEPPVN